MELTNRENLNLKTFTIDYRINRLDVRENMEVEVKNKPYVLWGNVNNDYPQFLLQVKENSPVLSVAIDSKVKMGFGEGAEIEGFGNVMVTPIINQPQVAIMATGTIKKKPAVIETPYGDTIGIRHMMFLSLSYDHRVVDGSLGGSFLRKVADYLEEFDINRAF
jgi:hypothetical protein